MSWVCVEGATELETGILKTHRSRSMVKGQQQVRQSQEGLPVWSALHVGRLLLGIFAGVVTKTVVQKLPLQVLGKKHWREAGDACHGLFAFLLKR